MYRCSYSSLCLLHNILETLGVAVHALQEARCDVLIIMKEEPEEAGKEERKKYLFVYVYVMSLYLS